MWRPQPEFITDLTPSLDTSNYFWSLLWRNTRELLTGTSVPL